MISNAVLPELEPKFLEITRLILFLAGKACVRYGRQGGVKPNVLSL